MKIKIYEFNTNELLSSFDVQDSEKAYEYARQMEEMGIEIRMESPSINHSLGESLGMSEEQLENLTVAIDEEIASHNTCCPETLNEEDHSNNVR